MLGLQTSKIKTADGIKFANQLVFNHRDYFGLSRWVQYNCKSPLNVEEGGRKVSVGVIQCQIHSTIAGFEDRRAEECWLLALEAGEKEMDLSSQNFQKATGFCH